MVGGVGIGGRLGAIRELDFATTRAHGLDIVAKPEKPGALKREGVEVVLQGGVLTFGFAVKIALKLVELVGAMKELDSLFETHCDEQTDDDSGDVDAEVAPGSGGMMGGVDVEHGLSSKYAAIIPHLKGEMVVHPHRASDFACNAPGRRSAALSRIAPG